MKENNATSGNGAKPTPETIVTPTGTYRSPSQAQLRPLIAKHAETSDYPHAAALAEWMVLNGPKRVAPLSAEKRAEILSDPVGRLAAEHAGYLNIIQAAPANSVSLLDIPMECDYIPIPDEQLNGHLKHAQALVAAIIAKANANDADFRLFQLTIGINRQQCGDRLDMDDVAGMVTGQRPLTHSFLAALDCLAEEYGIKSQAQKASGKVALR